MNRVSGALQVVDVEAAEMAVAPSTAVGDAIAAVDGEALASNGVAPEAAPAQQQPAASGAGPSLFAHCHDHQLMLLGVPEALLPALRAVTSEETLTRLIEWMPQDCVDGLILLADGKPIEAVIEELERQRPAAIDPTDLVAALETPESKAEFLVITDDDVLEAMLSRHRWSAGASSSTPASAAWWSGIGAVRFGCSAEPALARPWWRCTEPVGSPSS